MNEETTSNSTVSILPATLGCEVDVLQRRGGYRKVRDAVVITALCLAGVCVCVCSEIMVGFACFCVFLRVLQNLQRQAL